MKPALFVAAGCGLVLVGAVWAGHVISTPDGVPAWEPPPPAIAAMQPPAPPRPRPPPIVRDESLAPRRDAPPRRELNAARGDRPEFDSADRDLANANASNDSIRAAYGLFERCVKYEPENKRCQESLALAGKRQASMPPDPVRPKEISVKEPLREHRSLATDAAGAIKRRERGAPLRTLSPDLQNARKSDAVMEPRVRRATEKPN